MPLPPPLPSQRRVAVPKQLQPRSSQKRPTDALALAPLKALKVSPSSTAHWVVEAQAAIQHGAASVAQGGAVEASLTQIGEGAPPPHKAEAHESDGAEAPSVAEATEVKAPQASKAKATEAGVPRTTKAAAAGAGAPGTTKATGAEANVSAARLAAQEVEMKAAEASVAPLVQGALHTGVKRALAIIASHYIGVNLTAISDGYVLPDDDGEADEEVAKLMEVAEGPDTALAKMFEEEVVPLTPSADARDPEA
ncbi:uncharacterized protein [Miscanthus floridulus]|uniref:uncharacterized protein n=1 Tax=Miscanthus floridulus TaxID=154761 RepID=UPI0034573BB8